MRRRGLFAVALVAATLGCARVERLVNPAPQPPPTKGAWAEQHSAWTRKASLYDGLAMRALATATYEAPELRRARAERLATWKAMTPEESAALLAQEESEGTQYDDFVLSITTGDSADNDLDSRRTTWRVALVAPGHPERVGPEITELRSDALLRTLYSDVGDFDVVYRIRFTRPAETQTWSEPFTLRIAGPRGRLDFAFGVAAAGTK